MQTTITIPTPHGNVLIFDSGRRYDINSMAEWATLFHKLTEDADSGWLNEFSFMRAWKLQRPDGGLYRADGALFDVMDGTVRSQYARQGILSPYDRVSALYEHFHYEIVEDTASVGDPDPTTKRGYLIQIVGNDYLGVQLTAVDGTRSPLYFLPLAKPGNEPVHRGDAYEAFNHLFNHPAEARVTFSDRSVARFAAAHTYGNRHHAFQLTSDPNAPGFATGKLAYMFIRLWQRAKAGRNSGEVLDALITGQQPDDTIRAAYLHHFIDATEVPRVEDTGCPDLVELAILRAELYGVEGGRPDEIDVESVSSVDTNSGAMDRCMLCEKKVTNPRQWVHLTTTGKLTSRPEHPDSQGCFPVGPDCARKLPPAYVFNEPTQGDPVPPAEDPDDNLPVGTLVHYKGAVCRVERSYNEARAGNAVDLLILPDADCPGGTHECIPQRTVTPIVLDPGNRACDLATASYALRLGMIQAIIEAMPKKEWYLGSGIRLFWSDGEVLYGDGDEMESIYGMDERDLRYVYNVATDRY